MLRQKRCTPEFRDGRPEKRAFHGIHPGIPQPRRLEVRRRKYGIRTEEDVADSVNMVEATRSEGFGREVKRRIMLGTFVLSAGYYDAYYRKAQQVRSLIKKDFDKAFEKVDCMITPASPCLPFKLGEKTLEPLQMDLVDVYTVSLNLSGLPGMSIPCGTINGLPVGMQIIGKPFDEEMVLRVAHEYEKLKEE